MSSASEQIKVPRGLAQSIFGRVLVGIDGSRESLEAARQAARLATGPVSMLAAYDVAQAVVGGGMLTAPVHLDEEPFRAEAEHALEEASDEVAPIPVTTQVVRDRPWAALLDRIAARDYTLIAVGSHGTGRTKGIVIGSTATEIVHKAPCSVLVARTPLLKFPSRIVVGIDGSPEAAAADAVGSQLAERFGAELARHENVPHPARHLVNLAMEADLLIVGSRGLHGVKALGSVSERVAHEAKCSVLVVR